MEQLWNFAWPSAIALLHPSLLPVAVIGFFTKVVSDLEKMNKACAIVLEEHNF